MYIVELQRFKFFGEDIGVNLEALLDTGNTLISIPMHFKDQIFNLFSQKDIECEVYKEANSDFFQLGCKVGDLNQLPDFEVELDGVLFKVEGDKLIDRCTRSFYFFGSYSCLLTIEFQKLGREIILGNFFIYLF